MSKKTVVYNRYTESPVTDLDTISVEDEAGAVVIMEVTHYREDGGEDGQVTCHMSAQTTCQLIDALQAHLKNICEHNEPHGNEAGEPKYVNADTIARYLREEERSLTKAHVRIDDVEERVRLIETYGHDHPYKGDCRKEGE